MKWYRSLDTFSADLPSGPVQVVKGATLPASHAAVKHDLENGGKLFILVDPGEDEQAPSAPRRIRAPKGM